MLVKRSIVEKWYQRDSWVYQNFAYLFKNPLWQKSIPNGFSVCPYFWLNIFSFLVFRPFFVFPIQYLILPMIRLIGRPAHAVDEFIHKLLKKFTGCNYHSGVGFLALFTGTFLLSLLCLIGIYTYRGLQQFYPYVTSTTLGTFAFWSIASFVSLWGIIALHKKITDTECKTINYLWVWLILFTIGIFVFVPSEFAYGTGVFFKTLGSVIWTVLSAIWIGLCFIAKWIWAGIAWTPVKSLFIPWWGYILLATVGSWVGQKLFHSTQLPDANTKTQTESEEEFQKRCKQAWISLFVRTLNCNRFFKKGKVFKDFLYEELESSFHVEGAQLYQHGIYEKAFEIMYKEEWDTLKKSYPFFNREQWKNIESIGSSDVRFNFLFEATGEVTSELSFDLYDYKKILKSVVKLPEFKKVIDLYAAQQKAIDDAKRAKREAKRNSWSHIMCMRVTGALNNGFTRTGKGIAWGAIQCWTFLCYMWMLVKAKKQGACPYFKFTDPNNKPS